MCTLAYELLIHTHTHSYAHTHTHTHTHIHAHTHTCTLKHMHTYFCNILSILLSYKFSLRLLGMWVWERMICTLDNQTVWLCYNIIYLCTFWWRNWRSTPWLNLAINNLQFELHVLIRQPCSCVVTLVGWVEEKSHQVIFQWETEIAEHYLVGSLSYLEWNICLQSLPTNCAICGICFWYTLSDNSRQEACYVLIVSWDEDNGIFNCIVCLLLV